MFASSSLILSWGLVYLLGGAVLFVVDRHVGKKAYRWWYDMTHELPLPTDREKGFLHQQSASRRCRGFVILTAVVGGIAVVQSEATAPEELLSMFIAVPCLTLGSYFGPLLDRLWHRRVVVFETMDQFESGERKLGNELHLLSKRAASTVASTLNSPAVPSVDDGGPHVHADDSTRVDSTGPSLTGHAPVPREEVDPEPKVLMSRYLSRQ